MKKWESEKHKSWDMTVEGFKGHVAIDGSLLGKTGKWGACGWAVVQPDYDEEMGLVHGVCGSADTELEVQRTIKRAELTAFLCLFKKSYWANQGPLLTTRELSMDYENEKVSVFSQEREMLVLRIQTWEELHGLAERGSLVEVGACFGAPHEERKEKYVAVWRFVTEGNEKADELAIAGAMLDEGFLDVCSFAVCSQLPLLGRSVGGL